MKKYLLLLLAVSGFAQTPFSGGIKTSRIDGYVNQDISINSTTGGVLIPRMTTTQKEAIASPTMFTQVIDVTLGKYQYYDGSAWVDSFGGGSQDLQQTLANGDTVDFGTDYRFRITEYNTGYRSVAGLFNSYISANEHLIEQSFDGGYSNLAMGRDGFSDTYIKYINTSLGFFGTTSITFDPATAFEERSFKIPYENDTAAGRQWVIDNFSSGGGAVDSVNGQTGVVALDADDISDSATTNKFTTAAEKATWNAKGNGTVTNVTGVSGETTVANNTTTPVIGIAAAYTAARDAVANGKVENNLTASTTVAPSKTAVNNALAFKEDVANKATTMTGNTASNTLYLTAKAVYDWAIGLFAPINSPTFTGDPKAPTPTAGDNDTSIATTAFTTGAIATASTASTAYTDGVAATKISQGGDSFGASMVIGTNDANAILVRTSGTNRFQFSGINFLMGTGGSISNSTNANLSSYMVGGNSSATTITRAANDAQSALDVTNGNTSSAAPIIRFLSNIGGTTATRAQILKTGQVEVADATASNQAMTLGQLGSISTSTVALTKAALNTAYPNVPVGHVVQAKDVTTGPMIYIKNSEAGTSDVWLSIVATLTP